MKSVCSSSNTNERGEKKRLLCSRESPFPIFTKNTVSFHFLPQSLHQETIVRVRWLTRSAGIDRGGLARPVAKIQQDLPFLNSRPATISSSHCFSLASRRNIMVFVIRSTKNSRNLRFDDPHATFPSINRTEKDSSKLVAISLDEKKSNKSKNQLILLKLITRYIDKCRVSRNTILEYYLARLDFDPFGGIVEPKYKEECRIFFLLCANEKDRTTDFSLGTFPVYSTSRQENIRVRRTIEPEIKQERQLSRDFSSVFGKTRCRCD